MKAKYLKTGYLSLAIAVLGAGFIWHSTDGLQALTAESARRLSVSQLKPAISNVMLETMSGNMETLVKHNNQVVVAEFIYTTCPDICQTGGSDLAKLRDRVIEEGLADKVRIFSISFDPETDDPVQLKYYGDRHNALNNIWTIARPSVTALPSLLKEFGIVVIRDGLGGYEHNAAMHIIEPKGRLAAIIDTDDIAGAIQEIKEAL